MNERGRELGFAAGKAVRNFLPPHISFENICASASDTRLLTDQVCFRRYQSYTEQRAHTTGHSVGQSGYIAYYIQLYSPNGSNIKTNNLTKHNNIKISSPIMFQMPHV